MPLIGRDPRKFGTNHDIDLVDLTQVEFPIHAVVKLDGQAKAAKRAASNAIEASCPAARRRAGWSVWRSAGEGRESFMRAYPEPKPGERRERDLFEGVTGV